MPRQANAQARSALFIELGAGVFFTHFSPPSVVRMDHEHSRSISNGNKVNVETFYLLKLYFKFVSTLYAHNNRGTTPMRRFT